MRAGFEPKSLYTMPIDFTGEAGQLPPVVIYITISVAVLTFLKIYCVPHSDEAQWILEMDACFCTLQRDEIDDLYLIEMDWGLDWATWSEMKEN